MGRGLSTRNHPQRLTRLEARLLARTLDTASTAFDPTRLTDTERDELEELTSQLRRHPNGRWNFSALDTAQLERLEVLVAKGQGAGLVDGGPTR